MELKDLHCFLALADELNFTRAAARVHMAQPPFSQRIKRLEESIGTPLFERSNKWVRPTQAGAALEPLALQILNATRSAIETTRHVGHGVAGQVSLGAIYSSVYRAVPDLIREVAARYPRIELNVEEMPVEQQLAAIRSGQIDGGILRLTRREKDIETALLYQEHCVAALNTAHPLAKKSKVTMKELARETLIAFEHAFSPEYDSMVSSAFAARKLSPYDVRCVRSMHMMLGLVGAGVGVAIVPSTLAQIQVERVTYVAIQEALPKQEIRLAWLANSPPPAVLRLAEIARAMSWTSSRGLPAPARRHQKRPRSPTAQPKQA